MSDQDKWLGGELLIAGLTDFEQVARRSKSKGGDEKREKAYPDLTSPTRLRSLLNVKVDFVAAGTAAQHLIVVDVNGAAYSMGRNHCGQLGLNDQIMRNMPVVIPDLEDRVVSAACGRSHTLLVTEGGTAWSCGSNKFGQLGTGKCSAQKKTEDNSLKLVQSILTSTVMKVAAGAEFSMWLDEDGRLYAAGNGERGELGDGSNHTFNSSASSIKMEVEPQPRPALVSVLSKKKVLDVACGINHAVALTDEVNLYTWGCGDYGRLGHNVQKDELRPRKVDSFTNYRKLPSTTILACGGTSTLVSAGKLSYIWGKIKTSGDSLMVPEMSNDLQGWQVRSISAGPTTFAVATETSCITWGAAQHGELGNGPKGKKSSAMPALCKPLEGLLTHQVECGNSFTLCVMDTSHNATLEAMEDFDIRDAPEMDPFAEASEVSVPSKKRGKVAANSKSKAKTTSSKKRRK